LGLGPLPFFVLLVSEVRAFAEGAVAVALGFRAFAEAGARCFAEAQDEADDISH